MEAVWTGGAVATGYLARPAGGMPRAGIIVCAGEDGASEFLRGVTRRLAKDGYAGLLVDRLSCAGGTSAEPPAGRAAHPAAPGAAARLLSRGAAVLRRTASGRCPTGDEGLPWEGVGDIQGAAAYLAEEAGVSVHRIGLLGFAFGGLAAWAAARSSLAPVARALVVYGTRPAFLTHPERVQAAVQLHYGALDRRALADLPALEQRLREAGSVYDLRVHAGASRTFWEPGRAAAGASGAAAADAAVEAAWRETLRWFETHLVQRAPSTTPATAPRRPRPN